MKCSTNKQPHPTVIQYVLEILAEVLGVTSDEHALLAEVQPRHSVVRERRDERAQRLEGRHANLQKDAPRVGKGNKLYAECLCVWVCLCMSVCLPICVSV